MQFMMRGCKEILVGLRGNKQKSPGTTDLENGTTEASVVSLRAYKPYTFQVPEWLMYLTSR